MENEINRLLEALDEPNICTIRGKGIDDFAACNNLREGLNVAHKKSGEGISVTLTVNNKIIPHIQIVELWKRISNAND
jgi:hypothetical protein